MGRPSGRLALAFCVGAACAIGCRFVAPVDRKPHTKPRCDGDLCVEIVSATLNRATIGMWIDAPPGTVLHNARVSEAAAPPCSAGLAVEWVTLDRTLLTAGPADVGGAHGLVLSFPLTIWHYDQGENFVDLELIVAGRRRCTRSRLTGPDSHFAIGS